MAAPLGDHLYVRQKIQKPDERSPCLIHIPAGEHSYCKPSTPAVRPVPVSVTPKKITRKRNRDSSTPTGKTPKQLEKKLPCASRWTEEEKKCILEFLQDNEPPSPITNVYWRTCAAFINEKLQTSRTGASCRSFYNRVKSYNVEPAFLSYDTPDSSTVIESMSQEAAVQTEWSFPSSFSDHATLREEELEEENISSVLSKLSHVQTKLSSCGSNIKIAKMLLTDEKLKSAIWTVFLEEIEESSKYMTQRRLSCLGNTGYAALCTFNWETVVTEMAKENPLLAEVLVTVSTRRKDVGNTEHFKRITPELGLIYGILMKRRFKDLSQVQRVITMALAEEKVHQKVYDRLQPVGVTVSHSVAIKIQKQIGGHFNAKLIDAVKEGRKFRIVGDNVNHMITSSRQRQNVAKKMEHWFASAAIIQNTNFTDLGKQVPQQMILYVQPSFFLPSVDDWRIIRQNYIILIFSVLVKFCEKFKCFSKAVEQMRKNLCPSSHDISEKNVVISLPVLGKNEQKYADVIEIMDSYENTIEEIYFKAGAAFTEKTKVHVGGDQLTRERFSGAKRLRSDALTDKEKFVHLSPITFEFFHLQMCVLSLMYRLLYNNNSIEIGTLHGEKIRLSRVDADGNDVKNHYEHCKELAVSVTDAHIVEAALEYFGMETLNSSPLKNIPSDFEEITQNEQFEIICTSLGQMVDQFVIKEAEQSFLNDASCDNMMKIIVSLPNGMPVQLLVPVSTDKVSVKRLPQDTDGVNIYATRVLEIGLLFKSLLNNVKIPNRDHMLPLMKYLMCVLKSHNNRSKYALEILRFLCYQTCILDETTAYETFYGLFVNTRGKFDTSIGADLQMEHLVHMIKGHLKSVQSNKSQTTLAKRTAAFAGMEIISSRFDEVTNIIRRAQKHKTISAVQDEQMVIDGLRRVRPFQVHLGRELPSYPRPVQSPLNHMNVTKITEWIREHQYNFFHEIGN